MKGATHISIVRVKMFKCVSHLGFWTPKYQYRKFLNNVTYPFLNKIGELVQIIGVPSREEEQAWLPVNWKSNENFVQNPNFWELSAELLPMASSLNFKARLWVRLDNKDTYSKYQTKYYNGSVHKTVRRVINEGRC